MDVRVCITAAQVAAAEEFITASNAHPVGGSSEWDDIPEVPRWIGG